MALDSFIASVRAKVANSFNFKTDAEINAFFIGLEESAKDNQEALEKRDKMLRDTVAELCEAKRLLKAAVEDIYKARKGWNCSICDMPPEPTERCQYEYGEDCQFKWLYEDEVQKVIGDE